MCWLRWQEYFSLYQANSRDASLLFLFCCSSPFANAKNLLNKPRNKSWAAFGCYKVHIEWTLLPRDGCSCRAGASTTQSCPKILLKIIKGIIIRPKVAEIVQRTRNFIVRNKCWGESKGGRTATISVSFRVSRRCNRDLIEKPTETASHSKLWHSRSFRSYQLHCHSFLHFSPTEICFFDNLLTSFKSANAAYTCHRAQSCRTCHTVARKKINYISCAVQLSSGNEKLLHAFSHGQCNWHHQHFTGDQLEG